MDFREFMYVFSLVLGLSMKIVPALRGRKMLFNRQDLKEVWFYIDWMIIFVFPQFITMMWVALFIFCRKDAWREFKALYEPI